MPSPQARVLVLGHPSQTTRTLQSLPDAPPYHLKTAQSLQEAQSLLQDDIFDAAIIHQRGPISFPPDPTLFVDKHDVEVPCIWITAAPNLDTALEAVNNDIFRYLPASVSGPRLHEDVQAAITWSRFKRLIYRTERRTTSVAQRLQRMKQAVSESPTRPGEQMLDAFFELVFERVIDGYLDAKQLLFILAQDNPKALEQSLRNDPVRRHLIEATEEAVDVIESTKHQFKSKRLAQVRKSLEAALQSARQADDLTGRTGPSANRT